MVCSLQLESKYAGETGKNIFQRGSQYVDDVDKKRGKREEKIYTKLEVLSFEKAWDEIERDTMAKL